MNPVDKERAELNAQRKFRKAAALTQARRDAFVRAALTTAEGRDYLWWLLESAGVFRQPFTSNALQTSFNCGELNSGNRILAHITSVDPDGFIRLLKEKQNVDRSRNIDDAGLARDLDERAADDSGADSPGPDE